MITSWECFDFSFFVDETAGELEKWDFENKLESLFWNKVWWKWLSNIPWIWNKYISLRKYISYDNQNYRQYCLAVYDCIFKSSTFEKNIKDIHLFVDGLFEKDGLKYIFCSYEINTYLFDKYEMYDWTKISNDNIHSFPITFLKNDISKSLCIKWERLKYSTLSLNLQAQNIF